MLRVGLTGGIGAGKSAVARALADPGAIVIDADQLARDVVSPGPPVWLVWWRNSAKRSCRTDGSLDRIGSARSSSPTRSEWERLNAIVHPLVAERTAALIDAAPPDAVVVQDIPLLVENGLAPQFVLVIVVEAPGRCPAAATIHDRGMTPDEAHARLAAQATDKERRAVADVVIVERTAPG